MKFNKVGMFLFLLLIGLTVVSAADVTSDDATPTDIQDVVEETNIQKEVNVDNTLTKETKTVKQDETTPVSITTDVTINNDNLDTYNNKNWTVAQGVTVTGTTGVPLTNVAIDVLGNQVTLDGLTISNTDSSNYIINANDKTDLTIKNSALTITNNQDINTFGIILKDMGDVLIDDITLNVYSPSKDMEWGSYNITEDGENITIYYSVPKVAAISVDSSNDIEIKDSTINIQNSTAYQSYTTMPAILIRNNTEDITINNNVITATGAQYVYGVMTADDVTREYITDNTVTVTGQLYVAGIDASTASNSEIKDNTITATSTYVNVPMFYGDESLAYGVISDCKRGVKTGNKICSNTITISANVTYGIEMYRGVNNMICSNTITSNGHRAMGVSIAFTNYTNIVNNVIRTTKTGDDYQYFYEEITPSNNGIKFTNQSNNNVIQGNDVFTTSVGDSVVKSVNITNATGNTIQYNYLWISNAVGSYSFGSQTIVADNGNQIVGDNNNIVQYQCNCGCMSNSENSINSLNADKTLKTDDEDVIVITADNMATYGYDRMVIYQLSKAPANGKTIIFSQDFPRAYIYVFGDQINCTVKELPVNTLTFGYSAGNYSLDGLYAPNATIQMQNKASGTITNSVFKSLNLNNIGDTIIANNTIIDDNLRSTFDSTNAVITDNYVVSYNATNVLAGNNAFSAGGTVENNMPTEQVDYVLNKTNYNTLFNEDNTLKDTVSGTILVVANITTPVIITNPVNIITAKNPGKYTYYDGTTVDIEYGLSDVTFAQGSSYSNITGAQIGNIKINDNGITVSNSNITGKVTVSSSGAIIKDNNIIGENALVELVNAETATIINNNIETNNTYAVTVDADSIENTVKDNTLIAGQLKGNSAIENNADDTVVENNGPLSDPELIIDTTEFTEGQAATITATIYRGEDVQTDINKGKVVFKVNGKTLKDANGKVIYAKVVNGTATIENYAVLSSWTKENTTITATYSGSAQCDKLSSQETQITINKSAPAITTSDIMATKTGTITLTANITDANKVINTGKVVFKINGKTVKDASGKVIYAKVVNGTVSVEYTLPETLKVGNYTITATYISSNTEKLETNSTITITE